MRIEVSHSRKMRKDRAKEEERREETDDVFRALRPVCREMLRRECAVSPLIAAWSFLNCGQRKNTQKIPDQHTHPFIWNTSATTIVGRERNRKIGRASCRER